MLLKTIVILISCSFSKAQFDTVRLTQYGPVRGQISTSRANSTVMYLSFRGIQYAAPPLGQLRFKEPQPPEPWTVMRRVIDPKPACLEFLYGVFYGSEDCLYLSVFIPITAANISALMPVMVWFHGGNWGYLSSNDVGPDYLMERPVVIVTVEYRLNVMGFFTTLDDNAKGNMGLKDQVLALRWIQNNIANFNGDPSRVTIIGSCAGSISVLYHMMSPLSRGLFSGGIGQSGSPLNGWALQRNPMEMTRRLLRTLEIKGRDNAEIVKKLQAIDARTLVQTSFDDSIVGYYYTLYDSQPFAPIVERESSTSFLSQSAYDLLQSGNYIRVPLIMGFNSQESENSYRLLDDKNQYRNDPLLLIPEEMNMLANSPCVNRTLNNITKRYFPDGNYSNPYELIPYLSLDIYELEYLKLIPLLQDNLPLYYYYLSYVGSRNTAILRPRGVEHTEEMQYVWYPHSSSGILRNPNETAADRLTRQRIVTMWTNFAAERNPTPRPDELLQNVAWPPIIASRQNYLNINSTLSVRSSIPNQSEMPFWLQQFQACGLPDPNPNS